MRATRTSTAKRNERMHRLFEEAEKKKSKYAHINAVQVLRRMTEKVERANHIQHSGGKLMAEDWSELFSLTNEAKAVLEYIKE